MEALGNKWEDCEGVEKAHRMLHVQIHRFLRLCRMHFVHLIPRSPFGSRTSFPFHIVSPESGGMGTGAPQADPPRPLQNYETLEQLSREVGQG